MKQRQSAVSVGTTLGIVFVIMGIAYGNAGVWMLGAILLSIGLLYGTREN